MPEKGKLETWILSPKDNRVINGTLLYKSSQIVTYAGDVNILGQSKEDAVDILV